MALSLRPYMSSMRQELPHATMPYVASPRCRLLFLLRAQCNPLLAFFAQCVIASSSEGSSDEGTRMQAASFLQGPQVTKSPAPGSLPPTMYTARADPGWLSLGMHHCCSPFNKLCQGDDAIRSCNGELLATPDNAAF